jgi:hypothetical protein
MHINQKQAKELVKVLERFIESGSIKKWFIQKILFAAEFIVI